LFKEDAKYTSQAKEEYMKVMRIVESNFGEKNIEVAKIKERYSG
jgi:hypothetical protein